MISIFSISNEYSTDRTIDWLFYFTSSIIRINTDQKIYDESKGTYYYEKDKQLSIGFVDKRKINGGNNKNIFVSPIFSDWHPLPLHQNSNSRDDFFTLPS